MDQKKADIRNISLLTEMQAKSELYTALTIVRKVVADIPDNEKAASISYSQQGHMRCVNYLRGLINIWEKKHGS